ncbi:MAG: glycoside hydrolase family 31 protein [Bacteroidota bacterium]
MESPHRHPRGGKRSPQIVKSWQIEESRVYLRCPETILEVTVYDDRMIRFRFSPDGFFEDDFSYATILEADSEEEAVSFEFLELADEFRLSTAELLIHISKTLHIKIFDQQGQLINEDERGFHWEPFQERGGNIVYCNKKIQKQESFFGLGDKSSRLNLRGMRYETWGSDAHGFEQTRDPLYKNIPFFLGLHSGIGYGIFFDNSFRTRFDFGHDRGDVCTFWSIGGDMNYYFFYGPELTKVVESYAKLTGVPELPPKWSLGYHQSKWSYFPEKEVKAIAQEMREHQIPCDAIHLDIDYMNGYRCFTWDESRFSDPKRFVSEMEIDGFKTVTILDPGIKIDREYEVYQTGIEGGHFCRRADGPLLRGEVWPGVCHFPDFTNPAAREWWADLIAEFSQSGVHGIWNDMNEPALLDIGTFPDDTRHAYDGHLCSHRKAHNVYGMQMARASYHGMKKGMFPRRPFALTRSGYAGLQRYAAVWTGDNLSSWEHLWIASIQVQRLSISGVSFAGSDVGGFIGDSNGELLARWMQLSVLHPFFRNHASGEFISQEPWAFGEPYTSAIRKAIQLRYQLLPYLYTVFWRHTQSGTPMIRPLCFLDQENPETYYRMEEFSLGNDLLACPISAPMAEGRLIYLPKGDWYNYWTDELVAGRQECWVDAPLDRFPLFVRAGAVLPHYPAMQFTNQEVIESLDLHVYYVVGTQSSELYEDTGDFYDYQQGNFHIRVFILRGEDKQLNLRQLNQGRYNSSYKTFQFHLHGLPSRPASIIADGEDVPFFPSDDQMTYELQVDKDFQEISIEW